MKVIFKDLKHGEIKLIPENLDDIWHLYNIIKEEDLIRSITYRSKEEKDDKIRSKKSEKKRMKLGIRVKEVKYHEFSDRLRVHGIIEEGPQELGSYHTLNINANSMDKISIIKEEWKHHELHRIDEAVKQRNQLILTFISLDEETATIAILRQSGIQWITDIKSKRSGKLYESIDTEKEYFGEIISVIKTNKDKDSPLIIVGPGFTKENFVKYGKNKDSLYFDNCLIHGTGGAGMNGIQETIKSGIVEKITKENRLVFETKLIEKLFEEIKKDGLATYGEKNVNNALINGAVKHLLISDILVRTKKGEELLRISKNNNSDFTIINTKHETGKTFEGIGGIGALLRFRI
jgi:protein pelota